MAAVREKPQLPVRNGRPQSADGVAADVGEPREDRKEKKRNSCRALNSGAAASRELRSRQMFNVSTDYLRQRPCPLRPSAQLPSPPHVISTRDPDLKDLRLFTSQTQFPNSSQSALFSSPEPHRSDTAPPHATHLGLRGSASLVWHRTLPRLAHQSAPNPLPASCPPRCQHFLRPAHCNFALPGHWTPPPCSTQGEIVRVCIARWQPAAANSWRPHFQHHCSPRREDALHIDPHHRRQLSAETQVNIWRCSAAPRPKPSPQARLLCSLFFNPPIRPPHTHCIRTDRHLVANLVVWPAIPALLPISFCIPPAR